MGRKGPRAKTKTVLKSVSKWKQFGSMPNLKFQTLLNKNHPNIIIANVHLNLMDLCESEVPRQGQRLLDSRNQGLVQTKIRSPILKNLRFMKVE